MEMSFIMKVFQQTVLLPIADLLNRLDSKVNEALSSFPEIEEIIGVGIGAPNGNHFTGMIQIRQI